VARIFVVGAGVVGTAVGRGFVEAGHSVTLVDISADRVDALVAAGLDATTRLDLRGEPSSFVFLAVPTPAGPQGYDLRAMAVASRDVGRAIGQAHAERGIAGRHSNRRDARGEGDGYAVHTVVTRSTVPPGTTTQLVGPAMAQASGTPEGVGFVLAANPEFLRGTSAEDDVRWPWMTVVGARSRRVGERLAALLEPFGGELRVFDKPETAELVKCAHNLYNATKISFWNEMWLVAQALGLDPDDIAGTASRSAEGSLNPGYGIRGGAPFAGRCMPKDTDGFLAFARELGLPMPLLDSVVDVNRHLAARVDGELEALSRGAGRVLDLREAELRDAVNAQPHSAAARGSGRTQARGQGASRGGPDGNVTAAPDDGGAASAGPAQETPGMEDTAFVQDRGFGPDSGSGQDTALGQDTGLGQDTAFDRDAGIGHDGRFGRDSRFGRDRRFGPEAFGLGEFVQDRSRPDGTFQHGAFGRDGGPDQDGRPAVPGARDPLWPDLPPVGPASRDPFTGDLGLDDQPYDGRDGRRDERW
jgi:UDPglucose 6-dehydrogenase